MSAGAALQAAIAAALKEIIELAGVYDGPPARAPFPYAVLDASNESDWGHKTAAGREVLVAVTLWDDQPVRLQSLADAAEAAVQTVAAPSGWSIVTLRLLRRRTIRDLSGPWATAIDFRARLLSAS